jgi:putative chitinase
MNLVKKYRSLLNSYGVNTPLRISHFMSQIEHESDLKLVREGLYYTSVVRLKSIFKTPFKGKTDSFVSQYLKNSEKLGNYVYANRMGNGDESSGDGFKYRGGGFLQNTGKTQYAKLQEETKIPLLENPDLILNEANAMICALHFWKKNNLNKFADADDLDAISDRINIGRDTDKVGDANGYQHRKELLQKHKSMNYEI